MKKQISFLIAALLGAGMALGQTSTGEYVYSIFQQHCASCHSNGSPAGGLDLEGSGLTDPMKMLNVYQNIVDQAPQNTHADAQGYKLVYPGNAWRSSLFRKINNGLQPNMLLDPAEGDPHSSAQHTITDAEKEAIRQWILFGAPGTGEVVDTSLLRRYYAGEAEPSFTSIPPAPDPALGFQIHLGPFFLESLEEVEYFWKYPTGLQQDVEVDKIEVLFGPYSHHFIMFEYQNQASANLKKNGLRLDNAHTLSQLVTVQQYADTLELPTGSAFFWEKNNILDLNSHYINYSHTRVAACEVYVNVYTKPSGTAAQEMKVALIANPSIWIPNDQQPHTFTDQVVNNNNEIFIWALTTHTHKYGTDFNVYTRTITGQRNDLIFDAEYEHGDPQQFYFGYDYRHPPIRYYQDYVSIKRREGLVYEASYVNTGSRPVGWGDTSDDEMMVLAFFFLEDTAGVSTQNPTSTGPALAPAEVRYGPNPISGSGFVEISGKPGEVFDLKLYDLQGKAIPVRMVRESGSNGQRFLVDAGGLEAGMYFIELRDAQGRLRFAGKWLVE
ncbi:MAG: T9SS type A sorting domain-containing protein [Bacteroidia bacterium]